MILLLEDDSVQVMLFQGLANGPSESVLSSDNVADALRILKRTAVSVCVVDLGVYHEDRFYEPTAGIDFIKRARNTGSPDMPIIVVSATRDPDILVPCFEAGCDDYVLKSDGIESAVTRTRIWLKAMPLQVEEMNAKRKAIVATLRQMRRNG